MEPPARPSPLEGDFYVSPRHLAGSTVIGDPGLQPAFDAGWKPVYDEDGNCYVTADDQRIRIGYLPEGEDNALWKITAHQQPFGEPLWAAAFSDTAPTEFVAAFTTSLLTAYEQPNDRFLHDGSGKPGQAYAPLFEAGWEVKDPLGRGRKLDFLAPDGMAGAWYDGRLGTSYSRTVSDQEMDSNNTRWGLWGGTRGGEWYVVFSSATPTTLIAATAAAVVDPEPVLRWAGELSLMTKRYALVTPVKPPSPTPLEVARRLPRSLPAVQVVTVPRWSTSTPSARLPAAPLSRPTARR
ncbi:DUF317 domain-containing protein [Streptomyces sp. NPDC051561]|uniref:DUF317 domain-containing protein n=1 Tax=Streptomyces sp. NPDC051561 TaxID=3365658 RepID=UPI00379286D6